MLELVRTTVHEKDGEPIQITGHLYVIKNGETVDEFVTLELPWKGNRTSISCIPPEPGAQETYNIEKVDSSPAFSYEHLWIKDVPNRTGIKIHRGNYYTQIEGCVLVGKDIVEIDGDGVVDVTSSTNSLRRLCSHIKDKDRIRISSSQVSSDAYS